MKFGNINIHNNRSEYKIININQNNLQEFQMLTHYHHQNFQKNSFKLSFSFFFKVFKLETFFLYPYLYYLYHYLKRDYPSIEC